MVGGWWNRFEGLFWILEALEFRDLVGISFLSWRDMIYEIIYTSLIKHRVDEILYFYIRGRNMYNLTAMKIVNQVDWNGGCSYLGIQALALHRLAIKLAPIVLQRNEELEYYRGNRLRIQRHISPPTGGISNSSK